MKKTIRKIILIGLLGLASLSPIIYETLKPKKNPYQASYEYALSKGLEEKIAEQLVEKLRYLDNNDKEFINIISSYPLELQKACVNSDILDNAHISKKELENTKKARLEGIVNPKEVYAVLANGSGPDNPERYSRTKTEYSLTNVLSFYKLLKHHNKIDDDNITLLIYNPSRIDIFNTATHDFFFKEPNNLFTIKNGKQVKSTVPPSELLPMLEDEIKIDARSTKDNFLNSIKNLKSDYNDSVYIVYSNPGGQVSGYFKKIITRDRSYVEFSGGIVADFHLNSAIRNLEYNKMVIIQNSCYSAGLLKNLDSLREIRNVLAVSSSNDGKGEIGDAIFIIDIVDKYLDNPKQSIKNIMKIEKKIYGKSEYHPEVFYFSEDGIRRSPEECSWFNEPLITPYQ